MEDLNEQAPDPDEESTPPEVDEGAPAWTTTFGDMMSLLLTFFILLFSMSELKMDRFLLASQSLREAIGGTAVEAIDDPMGLMPDPVDPDLQMQNPAEAAGTTENDASDGTGTPMAERLAKAYLDDIAKRLEDFIRENNLEDVLRVDHHEDGVYLRIQAGALFASGEAQISPTSRWILKYLSEVTASVDVEVVVTGHADNIPIRSSVFLSNWELSAARAAGVARELVAGGKDPQQIRVESYGEYRPLYDNSTPEGRAGNRRVELFFSWNDVLAMTLKWSEGLERAEG
jgi:chemotaxis protein MotB